MESPLWGSVKMASLQKVFRLLPVARILVTLRNKINYNSTILNMIVLVYVM